LPQENFDQSFKKTALAVFFLVVFYDCGQSYENTQNNYTEREPISIWHINYFTFKINILADQAIILNMDPYIIVELICPANIGITKEINNAVAMLLNVSANCLSWGF
jgi:hypothetical protein